MAAVLALIMLPVIASVACFIGAVHGDTSISSALAMAMFAALGTGVLAGAIRTAQLAENEVEQPT